MHFSSKQLTVSKVQWSASQSILRIVGMVSKKFPIFSLSFLTVGHLKGNIVDFFFSIVEVAEYCSSHKRHPVNNCDGRGAVNCRAGSEAKVMAT